MRSCGRSSIGVSLSLTQKTGGDEVLGCRGAEPKVNGLLDLCGTSGARLRNSQHSSEKDDKDNSLTALAWSHR